MDKNSNNIRNIYIKCTKTYNKKNFHKSQKTKEENMTEKNNKNKILNRDMDLFIDNIRKDDNIMIHNINLINSTNNITVYDSLQNIKKDYMKYPLNKYYSQCTCCGLDYLSSELTYKEDGAKLCPWCLQDLKEEENNGEGQCGETNNCGQAEKIIW